MLLEVRLVNMSTRARRYTTQAHVLACLQVVFHSASCQRTDPSPPLRKGSFYIIPLVRQSALRPRAFGHRLTAAILGTDPTERCKIKGFAGSVPSKFRPSTINPHLFCNCNLGEDSVTKKNPHLFYICSLGARLSHHINFDGFAAHPPRKDRAAASRSLSFPRRPDPYPRRKDRCSILKSNLKS